MRNLLIVAATLTAAVTLAPLAASAQFLAAPPNKPVPAATTERCEDGMGHLRRVYAKQINIMDDDWRVTIYPICEGRTDIALRSLGNATHLRGTVGRNDTLLAALDDEDYRADDVIGIRIGTNDNVTLFVHRSEY